jgi:hypothetical protein
MTMGYYLRLTLIGLALGKYQHSAMLAKHKRPFIRFGMMTWIINIAHNV